MTIADCKSLAPVGTITGGTRYSFNYNGQQLLTLRCFSSEGRHSFVVGSRVPRAQRVRRLREREGPRHQRAAPPLVGRRVVRQREVAHRGAGPAVDGLGPRLGRRELRRCGTARGRWSPDAADGQHVGHRVRREEGQGGVRAAGRDVGVDRRHVEPRSLYFKQLEDRLAPRRCGTSSVTAHN